MKRAAEPGVILGLNTQRHGQALGIEYVRERIAARGAAQRVGQLAGRAAGLYAPSGSVLSPSRGYFCPARAILLGGGDSQVQEAMLLSRDGNDTVTSLAAAGSAGPTEYACSLWQSNGSRMNAFSPSYGVGGPPCCSKYQPQPPHGRSLDPLTASTQHHMMPGISGIYRTSETPLLEVGPLPTS
jgi:hypothetical protein